MRLIRAVLAAACILGMAGGAEVSARAQGDHPDWHHDDWRARQA